MTKQQIPFNAELAAQAWKEKPEDLVYYRLYTRNGVPVRIERRRKSRQYPIVGKYSKMFDPCTSVRGVWTSDGYFVCKETPTINDLELYIVLDYD